MTRGLRPAAKLAPYQLVIVPIYRRDAQRGAVLETVERLRHSFEAAGLRVHVDERERQSPGFKFNDWEMRGVPLRVEIGPKMSRTIRRCWRGAMCRGAKANNLSRKIMSLSSRANSWMISSAICWTMRAAFRDAHIQDAASYDELRAIIAEGEWARAYWAGSDDDELAVKDETGATIRCFPSISRARLVNA